MDGRAFLQDDKAEPSHKKVLRSERKRRKDTNLDCADCPYALPDFKENELLGEQNLLKFLLRNFRGPLQTQESEQMVLRRP